MDPVNRRKWLGEFLDLNKARAVVWNCATRTLNITYCLPKLSSAHASVLGQLLSPEFWEQAMGNARTVTHGYFRWSVTKAKPARVYYDTESKELRIILQCEAVLSQGIGADLKWDQPELAIDFRD